jgi:hypothetical protein
LLFREVTDFHYDAHAVITQRVLHEHAERTQRAQRVPALCSASDPHQITVREGHLIAGFPRMSLPGNDPQS